MIFWLFGVAVSPSRNSFGFRHWGFLMVFQPFLVSPYQSSEMRNIPVFQKLFFAKQLIDLGAIFVPQQVCLVGCRAILFFNVNFHSRTLYFTSFKGSKLGHGKGKGNGDSKIKSETLAKVFFSYSSSISYIFPIFIIFGKHLILALIGSRGGGQSDCFRIYELFYDYVLFESGELFVAVLRFTCRRSRLLRSARMFALSRGEIGGSGSGVAIIIYDCVWRFLFICHLFFGDSFCVLAVLRFTAMWSRLLRSASLCVPPFWEGGRAGSGRSCNFCIFLYFEIFFVVVVCGSYAIYRHAIAAFMKCEVFPPSKGGGGAVG